MALIFISIFLGLIGFGIGTSLDINFAVFFGVIGFLSPGLYVLDQIYKKVDTSNKPSFLNPPIK
ncbi:hypothetical protein [Heliophilum fasciatum]|uniref:Uncharacterized protein n=1 Tax=Heliophilum fasciatum TaxID=35700 RepID=A0A4V2SW24_9FIRM|nr:hypothetical protein [Heliophilum fasciatum]MCW2279244.1 hypothetical protein [Heliophilum fasciatum]TCP60626.1 hypothetical protein EDD73_13514 [Heliophilum fasciatum]